MDFVFSFSVAERYDGRVEKSSGIEALFASVIAGIFHREGGAAEYLLGM